MSLAELAGLARRHWIVMIVILLLTMVVGYEFHHARPLYQSSGTILFSASPPGLPRTATVSGGNLITTADVIAKWVMTPAGAQGVRAAGGTGDYQFGLVNFYNQQYPAYNEPAATLQASSDDPAVAQQTFTAAFAVVRQDLRARQAALGIAPAARITISLVGGVSGPFPQVGYPKRTYAGLGLLAIIAAYSVATALDRHPRWAAALRIRLRIPARP